MSASVTVVVCTRDRYRDLCGTLDSLGQVILPEGMKGELIVVDNGSSDETPKIAERSHAGMLALRYLREPRKGRSFALNLGLSSSGGDVVALTDDDVRFPPDWLARLCAPIVSGEADAVAGGVALTPSLQRAWMQPFHRTMLASTEEQTGTGPIEMFGANMAVARRVLAHVREFDCELGPGALGFFDDILFSRQVAAAGLSVVAARDVSVEHCPDPRRLDHDEFVRRAVGQGRSLAYVDYHWEHASLALPLARWLKRSVGLWRLRLARSTEPSREGISREEFDRVVSVAYARQFWVETRRRRCYAYHGLRKADVGNRAATSVAAVA